MKSVETTTDTCNALLRDELSAIETYTRAVEKFGQEAGQSPLEGIRADHVANAGSLRRLTGIYGEVPACGSSPWGSLATAVEGLSAVLGETTTMMILQQGEEHGIRYYEVALDEDGLSEDLKDLIRYTMLPAQIAHLVELERYMADDF